MNPTSEDPHHPAGPSTLSALLRSHRRRARLTQAQLADLCGLGLRTIRDLELGLTRRPRKDTVRLLCDALHLDSAASQSLHLLADGLGIVVDRAAVSVAPQELPRPITDFTGRVNETDALWKLLGPGGLTEAPVIAAIYGMAGVGKSTLALQVAHTLIDAKAYPDGQLYVNLHGTTPGLRPLTPLDALGRMLRSLGLHPSNVPTDVEEAAARFRSIAAGRHLLLLLDNVQNAEQVRPLLPGSRTCATLLTSRHVLATLEAAHQIHLDVLTWPQALELLGRVAGADRIAADPSAAAEVVRRCGRLPLAIRIAGARLGARPAWPVRELAEHLAVAGRRLDWLEAGELAVGASFDASIGALQDSPDPLDRSAAAAFGLIGLPDGPDLATAAFAALLGRSATEAERLLERLVDAQLLMTPRPGRYQFHSLMRLHAREHLGRRYSEHERSSAMTRLVGFYTATAWRTLGLLRPGDRRLACAHPRWSKGGLTFDDASRALSWLESERANLLSAVSQAAQAAAGDGATIEAKLPGQLATALFGFFYTRSYWHNMMHVNEVALDVARRTRDRAGLANAHTDLGVAYQGLGRYRESVACHLQGLTVFRELDDRRGEAGTLNNLGLLHCLQGQYRSATACLQGSLASFRELGDRRGQASSLNNLGHAYEQLGLYPRAADCLKESLALFRELEAGLGQANSLNHLGVVNERIGNHREALACLKESIAIYMALGITGGQAEALRALGLVSARLGRQRSAIANLKESIAIFRELEAHRDQAVALLHLGDSLAAYGRNRAARAAWLEGLTLADALRIPEAGEIRTRLAAGRQQTGN